MNTLSYLDFFSYEKMKQFPGLYQINYLAGYSEDFSNALLINIIAQAVIQDPQKTLFIALEPTTLEALNSYFLLHKLEANFYPVESHDEFILIYKDLSDEEKNNVGAIFVSSNSFFNNKKLDQSKIQIAARARNAMTFNQATKGLIKVVSSVVAMEYSLFLKQYAPKSNLGTAFEAQSIVSIKMKDRKNAFFTCEKDVQGLSNFAVQFKLNNKTNELLPHIKNEKNFFLYKNPEAIICIRSRLVLTEAKDSFEFFEHINAPKSIKKTILNNSIQEFANKGTATKYVNIYYDYINLLTIMSDFCKKDFDPNLFCSVLEKNKFFSLPTEFYRKHKADLFSLMNLGEQKYIYEWFFKGNHQSLCDSVRMLKDLNKRKIKVNLNKGVKKIKEVHDNLMNIVEANDPEMNRPIKSQIKKMHWHNKQITIYNDEDQAEDLTILIPNCNREFKTIGNAMGLCIKNEMFWMDLVFNQHNILILKNDKNYLYCIEIDEDRTVMQAKGNFNQEIDDYTLVQITECIQNLDIK